MQRLASSSNFSKLEPFINPADARTLACAMAANLTVLKGQTLGQVTASGLYKLYASGASDGTEVAKVISSRNFVTDAVGNVYYGTEVPMTGPLSDPEPTALCYYKGDFLKTDLPSISQGEIDNLHGRILGAGANAIVHIP